MQPNGRALRVALCGARAPGRSRTGCPRFRKPWLYPLSYRGGACGAGGSSIAYPKSWPSIVPFGRPGAEGGVDAACERHTGVEPVFRAWEARVLAVVRMPRASCFRAWAWRLALVNHRIVFALAFPCCSGSPRPWPGSNWRLPASGAGALSSELRGRLPCGWCWCAVRTAVRSCFRAWPGACHRIGIGALPYGPLPYGVEEGAGISL